MTWAEEWVKKSQSPNKPSLDWINGYTKANGTEVKDHFRTEANETIADNLGTDIDKDGIAGYFDADADGDGIAEAIDQNGDGIADALRGLKDLIEKNLSDSD